MSPNTAENEKGTLGLYELIQSEARKYPRHERLKTQRPCYSYIRAGRDVEMTSFELSVLCS